MCLCERAYVWRISGWLGEDLVEMNWWLWRADGCVFGCFSSRLYCNARAPCETASLCSDLTALQTQRSAHSRLQTLVITAEDAQSVM